VEKPLGTGTENEEGTEVKSSREVLEGGAILSLAEAAAGAVERLGGVDFFRAAKEPGSGSGEGRIVRGLGIALVACDKRFDFSAADLILIGEVIVVLAVEDIRDGEMKHLVAASEFDDQIEVAGEGDKGVKPAGSGEARAADHDGAGDDEMGTEMFKGTMERGARIAGRRIRGIQFHERLNVWSRGQRGAVDRRLRGVGIEEREVAIADGGIGDGGNGGELALKFVREPEIVLIHECDEGGRGMEDTVVACDGDAAMRLTDPSCAREFDRDPGQIFGGIVIDDDDFPILKGLEMDGMERLA
jgi:hypothetical protein